jgi:hypothetical protein
MRMSTGGIPTTDNIPETKHLILSYSSEIKQINERTNIYLKFYFKIMFLSRVLKNRLSGIFSVGNPNISVVSGILSVVGIPLVLIPIGEEISFAHVWIRINV